MKVDMKFLIEVQFITLEIFYSSLQLATIR